VTQGEKRPLGLYARAGEFKPTGSEPPGFSCIRFAYPCELATRIMGDYTSRSQKPSVYAVSEGRPRLT